MIYSYYKYELFKKGGKNIREDEKIERLLLKTDDLNRLGI